MPLYTYTCIHKGYVYIVHSNCEAVCIAAIYIAAIHIYIYSYQQLCIYITAMPIYIYTHVYKTATPIYIHTRKYTAAMLRSIAMPVYIHSNTHGGDAVMYSNYEHSCLLCIYTYLKYVKLLCCTVAIDIATIYTYIHINIAAMPGQQLLPTMNSRTYGSLSARARVRARA